MNENLDQLREVAERATPGNWMWVNDREEEHIRAGECPYKHVAYTEYVESANALHIATFDPPTVLALIDRVQAAEAAVQRVREVCSSEAYEVANEYDTYDAVAVDNVLDALDGGEQE